MAYDDEGGKSRFNAGIALTERIDSLQRTINAAKFNPFAKNFETGTYNYEILIVAIDNMIAEGWDKFSDPEKEYCLKLLKILEMTNETFSPIVVVGEEQKINYENYQNFKKIFGYCERRIKEFYGKHNLNAPSIDEDDDYDY